MNLPPGSRPTALPIPLESASREGDGRGIHTPGWPTQGPISRDPFNSCIPGGSRSVSLSERVWPGGIDPMRTGSEVEPSSSFTLPCHPKSLLLVMGTTTATLPRPASRVARSRERLPQMPSWRPRAMRAELVRCGRPSWGTAIVNGVPASSAQTRIWVSPRREERARGTRNTPTNAKSATRERSMAGRSTFPRSRSAARLRCREQELPDTAGGR
jgi:hypothetical protein